MVIYTNEIFIPIPSNKAQYSSVLAGDSDTEIKERIYESKWTVPLLQNGIGGFTAKITDPDGAMTTLLTKGTEVKLYLDHDESGKLQFWGRIDYPKRQIKQEGKFVEIVGRHRSYFLNERKVCHSAISEDPGRILKDICDKYAPEVTYTAVETPGTELQTCEATTGWTASLCAIATSNTHQRGTKGLAMTNNSGAFAGAAMYYDFSTPFDMTNKSLLFWVYIIDQDMLDNLGNSSDICLQVVLTDTGSNGVTWNFYKTDLKVGWNRIICTKDDTEHDYTPDAGIDFSVIEQFKLFNYTPEATTDWSAGDLVIDDIWVIPTSKILSVNWNYKPFIECVKELCNASLYDSRIDNELDVAFFERNSKLIDDDAIVESDNYIDNEEFGEDDYYTRTRVTVEGQNVSGLPIFYTAITGVDDDQEDTEDAGGIREVYLKYTGANTYQKVKDLAIATLQTYVARPAQGSIKSFGLQNVLPGDNIWVVVPRNEIYSPYRAVTLIHQMGVKSGPWKTTTSFEEELKTTDNLLNMAYNQIEQSTATDNTNKMNFTFDFNYDDDILTQDHSNTKVTDGKLVMVDATILTGTWKSINRATTQNIQYLELRWKGKDMGASKFYYSTNGGVSWIQILKQNEIVSVPTSSQTRSLKIKVEMIVDSQNSNPEIDGLVVMYK